MTALDHDADDALAETTWPAFISLTVPVLSLALVAIAIATMVAAPDHDGPVDLAAVVAVAATAVPWLAWALVSWRHPEPRLRTGWARHLCEFDIVLAMLAVVLVAAWAGVIDLGSEAVPQLVAFPALFVVVLDVASRPQARAIATTAASYAVILLGIAASIDRAGSVDIVGVVAWHAGFLFAGGTAFAVRVAIIAIHRSSAVLAHQAAEATRRRVARDVHDVVAHTLAVTMLHITAARMAVARGSRSEATEALEEAERHGRASLVDIRRMVRLLRADEPVDEGPQPNLDDVDDLVEGYRAAGLSVDLTVVGATEQVSPVAGLALYRAAQEALANAARYGHGPARVELRVTDDVASLTVDNPVRPTPGAPRSNGGGSGLVGMRERIAAAGGTLTAAREGERWSVRALVPMSDARS